MATSPAGRQIFAVYGILQRAARDPELRARPGGVVQNAWETYKQQALAAGEQPPPLGLQTFNRLYGVVAGQVRAERALGTALATYRRTGFDQALTYEMWAPDIDARFQIPTQAPAISRIRFGVSVNYYGETYTRFLTWEPGLERPQSVAGLLDALEDVGASRLEKYGEEFDSVTDDISLSWL